MFDANLARHIGLAAAILYNLLLWQSQSEVVQNYDPDGWFYFTAKRFEQLTTYSANWFTKASDKLVKCGLVEKKRMFRHDANGVACLHFRVLITDWKMAFDETQLTQNVMGTHTKCDFNNIENKKENISPKSHKCVTDFGDSTKPSACEASSPSAPRPTSSDKDSLPFDVSERVVSVRPSKVEASKGQAKRRAFAVLGDIYKRFNLKGKPGVVEGKRVQAALEEGWTPDDLMKAVEWAREDDFYGDKVLIAQLSEAALKQYEAAQNAKNKPPVFNPEFDPDFDWEAAEARIRKAEEEGLI